MGARRQGARLEVRQQRRVLLGLLGDPVDRGVLARFESRSAGCRAGGAGPRGVDRVAVRARLGVAEHLVEPGLDAGRDRALEPGRLLVRLGPAEAHDRGQEPLEQRVASEDRVGRGAARGRSGRDRGRRSRRLGDEPVGRQPPEHLARRLGGDAEMPADLRGGHPVPSTAMTRSARRYSWAAAEISFAVSVRRVTASSYATAAPRRELHAAAQGDPDPAQPGGREHDPQDGSRAVRGLRAPDRDEDGRGQEADGEERAGPVGAR